MPFSPTVSDSPKTVTTTPGVTRAWSVTLGKYVFSASGAAWNLSFFSNAALRAAKVLSNASSCFSMVETSAASPALDTNESIALESACVPELFNAIFFTTPVLETITVWSLTIFSVTPFEPVTSTLPSLSEATIWPPILPTKPAVPRIAATAVAVRNSIMLPGFCFCTSKNTLPSRMFTATCFLSESKISTERTTSESSSIQSDEPSFKAHTASDSTAVRIWSFSTTFCPMRSLFQSPSLFRCKSTSPKALRTLAFSFDGASALADSTFAGAA